MIVGGFLDISLNSGSAGTYQVSVHAVSMNSTYQDRSVTLDFKTTGDEITRASITITQTSDNLIVITRNNKEIGQNNKIIGYAD